MNITPEQARNLPYDNYTTPWALIEDVVYDGRAWHAGPATVYDEDLVPLVAAAPIMAAQIAGMEWEYGVEQAIGTTQWFRSRPMAEAHAEVRGAYRLVRRLVGPVEEAE